MIDNSNNLKALFGNLQYTINNASLYGETFLWKMENGVQKVVLIEDCITRHIYTTKNAKRCIAAAMNLFKGLKKKNVLVILLNGNCIRHIHSYNLIAINISHCAYKKNQYNSIFKKEVSTIYEYCDLIQLRNLNLQAKYGITRISSSSTMIYALIIFNVMVFIRSISIGTYNYGISMDTLKAGESFRLFTYIFMHGNLKHLLGNMLSLFYFGRILIKKIGLLNFTSVYVGGGIIAGIVSTLFSEYVTKNTVIQTVGASGAIFAVIGALIYDALMQCNGENKKSILKYGLFLLLLNSVGPHIDAACHIGGFFAGIVILFIINSADEIRSNIAFVKSSKKIEKIFNKSTFTKFF